MNGKWFFIACLVIAIVVVGVIYVGGLVIDESKYPSIVKNSTDDFVEETVNETKELVDFSIPSLQENNDVKILDKISLLNFCLPI